MRNKLKPKYLQFDCKETKQLDLRQANAVLEHKPDIIILEYPNNNKTPDSPFNKYQAQMKPKELLEERLKGFPKEVIRIHPWVKADEIMWKNIVQLWSEGHQIMVYTTDGPNELTRELLEVWNYTYPCVKKNWLWWVRIYLRERIMANNMNWILTNYKGVPNPTTLIFLQSFHWNNVQFLMGNPTKNEVYNYYFGKFPEVGKKDIAGRIKSLNKVFYKYWTRYSEIQVC